MVIMLAVQLSREKEMVVAEWRRDPIKLRRDPNTDKWKMMKVLDDQKLKVMEAYSNLKTKAIKKFVFT